MTARKPRSLWMGDFVLAQCNIGTDGKRYALIIETHAALDARDIARLERWLVAARAWVENK